MTFAEPTTMVTDYVLAAAAAWCGARLLLASSSWWSRRLWALAFGALALAATLGGTWHGFSATFPAHTLDVLWKATVLIAGLTSFAMLAGSGFAVSAGPLRQAVLWIAGAKLIAYESWMLRHDDFVYVVADTGTALAGVALLHVHSLLRERDAASKWVLGGVALSLVAAAVQATGLSMHPRFNHNDLYHVVQTAAVVVFYRAARAFSDRASAPHAVQCL